MKTTLSLLAAILLSALAPARAQDTNTCFRFDLAPTIGVSSMYLVINSGGTYYKFGVQWSAGVSITSSVKVFIPASLVTTDAAGLPNNVFVAGVSGTTAVLPLQVFARSAQDWYKVSVTSVYSPAVPGTPAAFASPADSGNPVFQE